MALFENQKREVEAMLCLSAVLIGAGASLIWNYYKLKKRNLQPVQARITELYSRQLSKETKILRGSRFTYYPVVTYSLDGKENIRRCNVNASGANAFKPGDEMTLYLDPSTGAVLETPARLFPLILGIIILVTGLLAGLSILSVIL